MPKILFTVVLVFGLGGLLAGRVIGAEPTLPATSGPISVGASGGPTDDASPSDNPTSSRTPECQDDDEVDEVRPRPSDIGDDRADDGRRHDGDDDGDGGGDPTDDDNSGPGDGETTDDDNSGPGGTSSGSGSSGDDGSGSGSSGSGSDDSGNSGSGGGGDDD